MSSSRFITAVFAASVLAVSACSDNSKSSAPAGILAPSPAAPTTLHGVISKTGRDPAHELVLIQEDGSQIRLVSSAETSALAELEGAGVDVSGVFDSDLAFEITTFFVRQMHGAPVLDGVILEETTVDATENPVVNYRLQPSDGSDAQRISPSAEMLLHLGVRMWVRLDDVGNAAEFGIIGQ